MKSLAHFAWPLIAAGLLTGSAVAETAREPETKGAPVVSRRLSEDQYRQIIRDVFGADIKVGGRFEPDIREEYLLAVGASRVSITASGFEEYDKIARNVAEQVVSKEHRAALIPCKPAADTAADDACARTFLSEAGRLLYRRPLTDSELKTRVTIAAEGAAKTKNFYTGLGLGLQALLSAPDFLFRTEAVEDDPAHPGAYRINAYAKAERLSFFLWNAAPDTVLLTAAEKGQLDTKQGLARQVDRMLASPRLSNGVRAYFKDMFGFSDFGTLAKDSVLFPKYSFEVVRDAQEQTLRTIDDLLLVQKGDYRDLFTTRKTFLSAPLASIYKIPFAPDSGRWAAYEMPEGDPRAGILSQISFVALHSHPGRTSPTLRGKAIRELVLCQKVPPPPGNVNFTAVQDTASTVHRTARSRLTAHATEAMCTGCHKITDPIGLALENFDSSGAYRVSENGEKIDTAGDLNGVKFADAVGLGKVIHDSDAAPSCLVNRVYAYGMGRSATKDEQDWLRYVREAFASSGYRLSALLRTIATSDAFYRVAAPMQRADAATPSTQQVQQ